MANTYTQIYIQLVWAVKGRRNLISEEHRDEIQKYMTGIVTNRGQKLLAIYCNPDHVHLLIGMKPGISISNLTKEIKTGSSNFINHNQWMKGHFNWQEGFGGFSYSRNQIDSVVKYILNQEEHHKKISFKQEYIQLLNEFEIEYDEKYLFEDVYL